MTEKYRQIVLHVGMHKTGTTSIQNNAHRVRETLLEHDIYYPFFAYNDTVRVNHSGPLTALVCEEPDRYGQQWRVGLGDDVDSLQSAYQSSLKDILQNPKAQTLLLSGETTSVFHTEHLQKLREILTRHTEQLRVLVYIRDPLNSVASTLQQRVRGGSAKDRGPHIRNLAGVVRRRYTRLIEVFSDSLELINFHEEVAHEAGLVGSFLIRCGLPHEVASTLKFSSANPRTSMEAYKIMSAINKQYPAGPGTSTGRTRQYNDLRSLSYLPGQPFRLEGLEDESIREAIQEEAEWLEQTLNLKFPAQPESTLGQLWDDAVLFALEDSILELEHREHQIAAAEFLQAESIELRESQPYASAILEFIAQKIYKTEKAPVQAIAKRLGADYFKNGALQAERYSTQVALELMSIAEHLRPNGTTIKHSIEKYLKTLGK